MNTRKRLNEESDNRIIKKGNRNMEVDLDG